MVFNWKPANAEQLVREAVRLGADQRLLVHIGCACARVVLPLTREQDREVCTHAVETGDRWARGEASVEECERALAAARVAVDAAKADDSAEWECTPAAKAAKYAVESAFWAATVKDWVGWRAAPGTGEAEDAVRHAVLASEANLTVTRDAVLSVFTRDVLVSLQKKAVIAG